MRRSRKKYRAFIILNEVRNPELTKQERGGFTYFYWLEKLKHSYVTMSWEGRRVKKVYRAKAVHLNRT